MYLVNEYIHVSKGKIDNIISFEDVIISLEITEIINIPNNPTLSIIQGFLGKNIHKFLILSNITVKGMCVHMLGEGGGGGGNQLQRFLTTSPRDAINNRL